MTGGSIFRFLRPLVFVVIPALAGFTLPQAAAASSGPAMVKNINQSGSSNPDSLTTLGSTVFFSATDGVHGRELWKSDGTAAGTKMVKDVRAGSRGSFPADLINVNGTLFFTANDGTHGRELWKSNGTVTGTRMVKDLTNDEFSGTSTNYYLPVAVGNRLFSFVADCCVGGSSLVVSDGTSAGTYRIQKPLEDVTSARALGSKLFFVETDYGVDPPGQALWVSNGTSAGTHRFAPAPSADQMTILPASGNLLYFTAADSGVGPRLWRTDGTAIGTLALTAAGQLTATPAEAVYMNHAIYFASDGLWRTDGTAAGTLEVSGGSLRDLAKAGGRLFFIRGPQPETADDHLWISNGTKAGTRDLGQFGIDPGGLVGVGGYLCFFAGYTVEKPQLWQSDGTSIGTRLVKSFSFGGSGVPSVAVSGHLYFRANDGTHGNELWKYVP